MARQYLTPSKYAAIRIYGMKHNENFIRSHVISMDLSEFEIDSKDRLPTLAVEYILANYTIDDSKAGTMTVRTQRTKSFEGFDFISWDNEEPVTLWTAKRGES